MSMAFDKEKLRRALSDEAGFSGSVYETYRELKEKFEAEESFKFPALNLTQEQADGFIRLMQRGGMFFMEGNSVDITNTSETEDLHVFPPNFYLINVNGRVCKVTVPADVSIQEAIKSIQEAEDAEREPFDTSLLAGLNEHSQPNSRKPKNHDWYKFNNKRYGR